MKTRLVFLCAACVLLPVIAAVLCMMPTPERHGLQPLVRGLGGGPAVNLTGDAALFDSRLAPQCAWRHDPLPGGDLFCPFHRHWDPSPRIKTGPRKKTGSRSRK